MEWNKLEWNAAAGITFSNLFYLFGRVLLRKMICPEEPANLSNMCSKWNASYLVLHVRFTRPHLLHGTCVMEHVPQNTCCRTQVFALTSVSVT